MDYANLRQSPHEAQAVAERRRAAWLRARWLLGYLTARHGGPQLVLDDATGEWDARSQVMIPVEVYWLVAALTSSVSTEVQRAQAATLLVRHIPNKLMDPEVKDALYQRAGAEACPRAELLTLVGQEAVFLAFDHGRDVQAIRLGAPHVRWQDGRKAELRPGEILSMYPRRFDIYVRWLLKEARNALEAILLERPYPRPPRARDPLDDMQAARRASAADRARPPRPAPHWSEPIEKKRRRLDPGPLPAAGDPDCPTGIRAHQEKPADTSRSNAEMKAGSEPAKRADADRKALERLHRLAPVQATERRAEELLLAEDAVAKARAGAGLTEFQWEAVYAHDALGERFAEISRRLGKAEGTVKSHYWRGRRKLKEWAARAM